MIKRLSTLFIIMLIATISYQQTPLNVNFTTIAEPTPGQPYDVDFRVSDFDDLLSFQLFVLWDSTVLEIDTIPFVTSSLTDFDDSGITLPQESASMRKGVVRLNWFSFTLDPETLPDDHLLFTMRFNPIGAECDTTAIRIGSLGFQSNEVIDDNGDDIGVTADPLPVQIPGAGCDGGTGGNDGVGLIFSDQFVENGTNVCIPMTTENMDSISTFQGSAMWDPDVLSFTGVQEFGLPNLSSGGFNTDNADMGLLTYIWFDLSGVNPASIPDGGTIFEICFDVIGTSGESSIVKAFDGMSPQTPIQISNFDGDILPYFIEEGTITVTDPGVEFFNIIASNETACFGEEVCVDFTTQNFDDIAAIQLTMQWDSTILRYNRVENLNTTLGLFESFFNPNGGVDRLRLSWSDASTNGVTVPDGELLYTVCFDVNPNATEGQSTDIDFINDNVPIEIVNGDTETVLFEMIEGSVTVGCTVSLQVTVTDPLCDGDSNGTINVAISGGTAPYDCEFVKTGQSPMTQDDVASNCFIAGQSAGEYTITVTDDDGNSVSQIVDIMNPPPIVISGTTTPETCDMNGTIDFTVSGGTGTLTTSFDPVVNPSDAPAGIYILTATDENGCTATESFEVLDSCAPVIEITLELTNPSDCDPCGIVNVQCSGGTGNFSVSYSPAIFDLSCVPAGNYMVTCTDDAGNSESLAFVVMEEEVGAIVIDLDITPADCNASNGSVIYSLTGGCGVLTCGVALDTEPPSTPVNCSSISSYAPGNYIVIVTDEEGNTASSTFIVTAEADEALMVTVNGTTAADCDDLGSVDFTITGGCNPEFTINPGGFTTSDNLPANNYTLTVEDDTGASQSAFFTIADEGGAATLEIGTITTTNAPCASGFGSATFSYTGGCEPVMCILESSSGTVPDCDGTFLAPGDYTISFRGNMGATVSETFTIGSDATAINISVDANADCAIDITASGGTGPYTYVWTTPSGTINAEDLSNLPSDGDHTVTVTDSNGCTNSATVAVIDCKNEITLTGISVTSDFDGFGTPCAVNSNPCVGDGVIDGMIINGTAPYTITIRNQALEEFTFSEFPLTGVCAGNYTISVVDADGNSDDYESAVNVTSPDPIVITLDGAITCEDEGMSNGAIETMVSGGAGNYTFSWTPSGSNGPDNLNISAGMYILTVEDNNLCTAEMLFQVTDCNDPGECYEAISVITPNSDGINDLFVISCAGSTSNSLAIFDRFGKTVYEANNYNNDWSGVDQDNIDLVEGAYFWVLRLNFANGDSRIVKGTVTLLRN